MNIFSKKTLLGICAATIMSMSSGNAFACNTDHDFLIERLWESDFIFEGHLLRYEKEDALTNKGGQSYSKMVLVYKIDKSWKGASELEEIKAYPALPDLPDGKLPLFRVRPHEIVTLAKGDGKFKDSIHQGFICPATYPVTWQNKLLLFIRYPWAIF